MIALTLYSRTGCHLCGEMLAELEPLVAGRARVEVVDIDDDPALILRFGPIVPVLMHGDQELSRLRLDVDRVREILD